MRNQNNTRIEPIAGSAQSQIINIDATDNAANAIYYNPQGVEVSDVIVNLARTQTWTTAAPTTQRSMRINAATLASTAGSTVTLAATVEISGAPIAGTNVTITNPLALHIASGKTEFAASTASNASINIPVGTVPTSPTDGDVWQTTEGFYLRTGGKTIGPISGTVGYYICATSAITQTMNKNAETEIEFDTMEGNNGIVLGGAKLTIENEGVYNVWFNGNGTHTSGGTETISVWLEIDNVNVTNSRRDIPIEGNNTYHPIDYSFTIKTNGANKVLKIICSATDTDCQYKPSAALTTPVAPAKPSCSVIVTQVVDSSIIISGAINLDGGHPTSIYGGVTAINCGGV